MSTRESEINSSPADRLEDGCAPSGVNPAPPTPLMDMTEPIHITIPRSPDDPRLHRPAPPGVVIHYVQDLHPDDVEVVKGIRCTSVARTLIDCAQSSPREELREMFARARELGILDMEKMHRTRARVEWRPSLAMIDELIEEFS
jgi:hypothetical protein